MLSYMRLPSMLPNTSGILPAAFSKHADVAPCILNLTTVERSDISCSQNISEPFKEHYMDMDILAELTSFEEDEREFLEAPIMPMFPVTAPVDIPAPQSNGLSPILEEDEALSGAESVYTTPSAYDDAFIFPSSAGSTLSFGSESELFEPLALDFAPLVPMGSGIVIQRSPSPDAPAIVLIPPPEGDIDMPLRDYVDRETKWIYHLPEPRLLSAPAMSISGRVLDRSEYKAKQTPRVCLGPTCKGQCLLGQGGGVGQWCAATIAAGSGQSRSAPKNPQSGSSVRGTRSHAVTWSLLEELGIHIPSSTSVTMNWGWLSSSMSPTKIVSEEGWVDVCDEIEKEESTDSDKGSDLHELEALLQEAVAEKMQCASLLGFMLASLDKSLGGEWLPASIPDY